MKTHQLISVVFLCAACLASCKTDGPPASAKEARELMVGKQWSVKDAGVLESSYRANKGEPFVHTIQWLGAAKELSAESREMLNKFSQVTLMLDENKNPNDDTGNVAHLNGLNLQPKQGYYFTSTQEENAYDRTVKLYVVSVDAGGNMEKFPFTILEAGSKKILAVVPPELQPGNVVLSLEAQ